MRRGRVTILAVCVLSLSATACAKPAPKSVTEMAAEVRDVQLSPVGSIAGGPGYSAYLYAYQSDGLKVYAMVAVPDDDVPKDGFPVLVANHGHHPDPPNYGITADGKDWRPGDYYRRVPELFAAKGFLVVMPDYRGHNISEGREFTGGMLESRYYTEDVLNLLAGLDGLEQANTDKVFMWGHSMGGDVTLRVLVTSDRIKGASMWSSVGGDIWDQAYYYSRYKDPLAIDSSDIPKPVVARLRGNIADLDDDFDYRASEPLLHLDRLHTPINIQHAVGDRSAAYKWSERLAKELVVHGKSYAFHSYPGEDHLFSGPMLQQAVDRDAAFFRELMKEAE